MAREPGVCLARSDVLTDDEWNGQEDYLALHRAMGVDETLVCFCPISGAGDEASEVFLGRDTGGGNFSQRDRVVVREAMAAVAPLVGGPLARFAEPSPAALPPRARQVLRCLLEGDGDKQAAARLGISRFTVNVHTKLIFRHFAVQGRCGVGANGRIEVMALDMTSGRLAKAEIHRPGGLTDDELAAEAGWVRGLRIQ